MVKKLSLPELAGQVIVADYSGTAAPVKAVRSLHLGGVIAFSDNIDSLDQVRSANQRLERQIDRGWPVLTSVDQEGGIVERVKGRATRYPSFMSAGAARDSSLTRRAYRASAAELNGLGFLVDYAPNADVTMGPRDPAIGSRSAGSDPVAVSQQSRAAARGYLDSGVLPVLKHFPGHGAVTGDSHVGLPVQRRSIRELEATDLVPFADAVDAGLPAIMVGHLAVPAVEPGVPTSLSGKAINGLLREDLGFDGLVFTDSLQMAAVTERYTGAESAVRAVRAGADVVLMPPSPLGARAGLVRAVEEGDLPKRRLLQSATRMVAWLLHQQATRRSGKQPGSARVASRDLSAQAMTMVGGPCRGPLVNGAVTTTGDPVAVSHFTTAARSAGMRVLVRRAAPEKLTRAESEPPPRSQPQRPSRPGKNATSKAKRSYAEALAGWQRKQRAYRDYLSRRAAWQARERQRRSDLAAWQASEQERLDQATSIGFSGFDGGSVDGEIAVATNTPYALANVHSRVRIATYGNTPGAMSALVDVLLGEARAPGHLPVRMPRVPRRGC